MPIIKRYWISSYDFFSAQKLFKSSHVQFDEGSEWVHESLCDLFMSAVNEGYGCAEWNSLHEPSLSVSYVMDGEYYIFCLSDSRWKADTLSFIHILDTIRSMTYITVSYVYDEKSYRATPWIENIYYPYIYVRFEWSMAKSLAMLPNVFLFNRSELIDTNRFLCSIHDSEFNKAKRSDVIINKDTIEYFMKVDSPLIRFSVNKKILDDLSLHKHLLLDYTYHGIVKCTGNA